MSDLSQWARALDGDDRCLCGRRRPDHYTIGMGNKLYCRKASDLTYTAIRGVVALAMTLASEAENDES